MTRDRNDLLSRGLPVLLALTLAGCANTQLKSAWRDPGYSFGAMKQVLVIALAPKGGSATRTAEDAFAENMSKRGVRAVPSYTLNPSGGELSAEAWKRIVAENNFDAVLVSRLVDVKTVEREVPPTTVVQPGMPVGGYYNSNWYGYYSNSYQVVSQPGYTIKDQVAVIETKVFDAKTDKLIWAGTSDTRLGPDLNTDSLIRQFARIVTDSIFGKGVR